MGAVDPDSGPHICIESPLSHVTRSMEKRFEGVLNVSWDIVAQLK